MHVSANEILPSATLLRAAISQLMPVVSFALLVEALWRLVTEADKSHTRLMAAAVTIAVLMVFLDRLIALAM